MCSREASVLWAGFWWSHHDYAACRRSERASISWDSLGAPAPSPRFLRLAPGRSPAALGACGLPGDLLTPRAGERPCRPGCGLRCGRHRRCPARWCCSAPTEPNCGRARTSGVFLVSRFLGHRLPAALELPFLLLGGLRGPSPVEAGACQVVGLLDTFLAFKAALTVEALSADQGPAVGFQLRGALRPVPAAGPRVGTAAGLRGPRALPLLVAGLLEPSRPACCACLLCPNASGAWLPQPPWPPCHRPHPPLAPGAQSCLHQGAAGGVWPLSPQRRPRRAG